MRFVNGKMSKLPFTVYRLMRKKCEIENPKWLDMVSSYVANIGMNGGWIIQGNGFTNEYANVAVKRRLKVIYLKQWPEDKQK